MSEFRGMVTLVTGAGCSLGRAIARQFAAQGARLALNDINPDRLDETVDLILADGGEARSYVFDVAKRMPVEAMVSQILDDFGALHILINSAAVHPRARVTDMDEWDWHRTLDVNLGGPFFTMQRAGRVMMTGGGGAIVNLVAAEKPAAEMENSAAYLASQAGLVGLTRAAAVEFAPFNVRVNAVCSGETGGLPSDLPQIRTLDAVTAAVLRLCSPSAAHINGQVLEVGRTDAEIS